MTDESELAAEVEALLNELVEAEHLQLATRRGAHFLAFPLAHALERDQELDIEHWLVERREVSELFLDRDELRVRFTPVIARIAGQRPPERSHPDLIAAIAENLADRGAWAVYGDWLVEQGDPRGELLAIQLAGGDGASLLARYRAHFLGDIPADPDDERERAKLTWRNGFLQRAEIIDADLDTLLGLESSRFLEALVVRPWNGGITTSRGVHAMLESGGLGTLCELDLRGADLSPDLQRRLAARWPFVQLGPEDHYDDIDE